MSSAIPGVLRDGTKRVAPLTERQKFERWFAKSKARFGLDEGVHGDAAWAAWRARASHADRCATSQDEKGGVA